MNLIKIIDMFSSNQNMCKMNLFLDSYIFEYLLIELDLFLFTAQVALCGETFDVSFALPYVDYLPEIVPIKFSIRVSPTFSSYFGMLGIIDFFFTTSDGILMLLIT